MGEKPSRHMTAAGPSKHLERANSLNEGMFLTPKGDDILAHHIMGERRNAISTWHGHTFVSAVNRYGGGHFD